MKLKLEAINITETQQSFSFFKRKESVFSPFWHYHPELELTLITQGKGTRFIGDSISPYSEFDLVLCGENLPHHWVSLNDVNNTDQEAYVFHFKKEVFSSFPECHNFEAFFKRAKNGLHFVKPSDEIINKIRNFEQLSPISKLVSFIEIVQLLFNFEDTRQLVSDTYSDRYHIDKLQSKISKTNTYVLENSDKKLTINHMAEFTHLTPQSFCRWFKKHSGYSFITFLNIIRIEQACQYLLFSEQSIQNIAFTCGFESLSHFNRTFKKHKNKSPSEYRSN